MCIVNYNFIIFVRIILGLVLLIPAILAMISCIITSRIYHVILYLLFITGDCSFSMTVIVNLNIFFRFIKQSVRRNLKDKLENSFKSLYRLR